MDAICVARVQWLEVSHKYASVIQQVLAKNGADFDAVRQMDLTGPDGWSETSRFDEELAGGQPPVDSPFGSHYIRLIELTTECGGVLPEGILSRD